jgi:hypothetical protein
MAECVFPGNLIFRLNSVFIGIKNAYRRSPYITSDRPLSLEISTIIYSCRLIFVEQELGYLFEK